MFAHEVNPYSVMPRVNEQSLTKKIPKRLDFFTLTRYSARLLLFLSTVSFFLFPALFFTYFFPAPLLIYCCAFLGGCLCTHSFYFCYSIVFLFSLHLPQIPPRHSH